VLDRELPSGMKDQPPHNIESAGLKSVKEIMPNIPKSNSFVSPKESCVNNRASTQQVASSAVEDYINDDLGLPELLTEQQKKNLKKLTEERAKLLVFCIETIKNEMDAKGFEFYENSVRSLGVSLFIQITRYLP
jgi:hypothetical protein